MTPEEQKTLERLVRAVNIAYNSPGRLFVRGLLWGLATGIGATIILGAVVAAAAYLLKISGLYQTFEEMVKFTQNFKN